MAQTTLPTTMNAPKATDTLASKPSTASFRPSAKSPPPRGRRDSMTPSCATEGAPVPEPWERALDCRHQTLRLRLVEHDAERFRWLRPAPLRRRGLVLFVGSTLYVAIAAARS